MDRRALLAGGLAAAAALAAPPAPAWGRTPLGGTLRLGLPWPDRGLDPHAADDPRAAALAGAVFDGLYGRADDGRVVPALAAAFPERTPGGARVLLRRGLVTARGRPFVASDAVFGLERARRGAAAGLLGALGRITADGERALRVEGPEPDRLAALLADPLALVPARGSTPRAPAGTGAFDATRAGGALRLVRNLRAAGGAAFLDAVTVSVTRDLADGLRRFEAGELDVGWLGGGLHATRNDVTLLPGQRLAWVVLRSGADAGAWGAPGLAHALCGALAGAALAPLGVVADRESGEARWDGPEAGLLVDGAAPQLVAVAELIASTLGRGRLRPEPLPSAALRERVRAGRHALALDVVRAPDPRSDADGAVLAAAAGALGATRAPGLGADAAARALPLGLVGELHRAGVLARPFRAARDGALGRAWHLSE